MSLTHLSAPTLAVQAYEAVRQAIVDGSLARGEKVTERGLADLLNTSPTPVREAIRRLEQDRLLERRGLRTLVVTDVDATEIADISLIEDTLRAVAARLAATRASDDQLRRMAAALDSADMVIAASTSADEQRGLPAEQQAVDRVWQHLREFHRLVDQASGSPMLMHMLGMADAFGPGERRQVLRAEMLTERSAARQRYPQHRAILDALLARDANRAEALMLDHGHEAAAPRLKARQK